MRCSKCGAENPEGKKFCGDCGAALENRCPKCGAENLPGKKFCSDCGTPLAATGAPTQSSSPTKSTAEVRLPTRPSGAATSPDGERRHLTVLFSDLVGSTEIAAHLDAEDWREIAAQYQRTAAAAVTRFGGHVAKYLGDGLMVYFGWPEAHEDAAERAVRAGLALVDEVVALNGRLAAKYNVKLSVRVGIETGSVVMGHGGGGGADVFGDAPNVASRVQSAAEPNSVVITAAVHELVSGLFVVEDRGAHQLKGVEQPVRLYRPIKLTVARRRAHPAASIQTPFVGRDDDMCLLLSRWERVREGQGQLVLVTGEPGIGKSRLVGEFRGRIRDDPHVWVESAGEQLFQSTPFHAVTQILDQSLGWRGDESPEERVILLESRLEGAGLKLGEAVPLIAEMLGLPIPDKYPALMFAPEQKLKRLMANLTAWLLNVSRLQPMVVALEDLHWVDASTLELTRMLVEQAATAPLMLLCTARPEFRAAWPMRAHQAQIALNRLNERNTREIVAGVVTRAALAPDLIDAVVKRTDGVPLFAEELTRLILEREGRSAVREIPATLYDSLTARLDRLGPAKEVAQLAAVIGREFSYQLLHAVAAMGEPELQSALAKLADAELIYARGIAPETTYQFKHALIQDAAYEALLKSRRRQLHERTGVEIESLHAECLDDHLAELVHHYRAAGNLEKAVEYLQRAGKRAAAQGAESIAIEQLETALELVAKLPDDYVRRLQEIRLRILLGTSLMSVKGQGSSETGANYKRALEICDLVGGTPARFDAQWGLWVFHLSRAELRRAAELAQQLLASACESKDDSRHHAHANFVAGDTAFWCGQFKTAAEHLALAIAAARPENRPSRATVEDAAMFSRAYAAWTQYYLGLPDQALTTIRDCTRVARMLPHPGALAVANVFAAHLHLLRSEAGAAAECCRTSLSLADECGLAFYSIFAQLLAGCAAVQHGKHEEGVEAIKRGIASWQSVGSAISVPWFLGELAEGLRLMERCEEAVDVLREALRQAQESGQLQFAAELHRIRGMVSVAQGKFLEAESSFRSAMEMARKQGARMWELRATTSLARLLDKQGKRDEARAMLAQIYNWFTEGFDTADLKDAKALLEELSSQGA